MKNLITNGEKYFKKWSSIRKNYYCCVIDLSNIIEYNNRSNILK